MPPKYISTGRTNRADIANDVRLRIVREVITDECSCNTVAKQYEIPESTLRRYCVKFRDPVNNEDPIEVVGGYTSPRHVFTDVHEKLLKVYLLRASSLYFELTLIKIRKLAYDYAVKLDNSPETIQSNCKKRHKTSRSSSVCCCVINVLGNQILPMLIFPRVHFRLDF